MSSHAMTSSVDAIVPTTSADRRNATARSDAAPVVHVIGLWRRLLAAIIDGALLSPVLLGALWLAVQVADVDLGPLRSLRIESVLDLALAGSPAFFAAIGLSLLVVLLYQIIFIAIVARTPGMRLVGAHVVDVYGRRPALHRVVIRCLGWLTGLATLGLGLVWIGFDREKRGLHDWVAGTYVVRQSHGLRARHP